MLNAALNANTTPYHTPDGVRHAEKLPSICYLRYRPMRYSFIPVQERWFVTSVGLSQSFVVEQKVRRLLEQVKRVV